MTDGFITILYGNLFPFTVGTFRLQRLRLFLHVVFAVIRSNKTLVPLRISRYCFALTLGLWLVCGCCFVATAQAIPSTQAETQRVEDSLRAVFATFGIDTARINYINHICFVLQNRKPALSGKLSAEALAAARKIGYRKGEADALNRLGGLAEISGNYIRSMDYYLESKRIREAIRDTHGVTASLNNMALVQMHTGYYERARQNMHNALALANQLKDQSKIAWYNNGLGIVFREAGQYDSAYYYLKTGLRLRLQLGDSNQIYNSYFHLATAYVANNEPRLGIPILLANLEYSRKSNSNRSIAYAHLGLGKAYFKLGSYGEAIAHLRQSFEGSSRLGYSEISRDATEYLARCYAATRQYQQAYQADSLYHYMKDTLANLVNTRRIADLELSNTLMQKQQEIVMEQEKTDNQRQRALLLASALVLSVGLIFLVWRAYGQKHAAHKQLVHKNSEIDAKNLQLQRALQQLHEAQENLVTAEKLAALGRVVANVSHELNTPLGVIRASVLNLETRLDAVLHALVQVVPELPAAERNILTDLIALGSYEDEVEYSTREERQKRHELEGFLADLKIENSADLANLCLAAGITEGSKLLPYLTQPALTHLLQHAVHTRQVRRSLFNIRLSVDKTRKVVQMLRAMSSKRSTSTAERIHLQQNLQETIDLYESNLRDGVVTKVHLPEAPCFVRGNGYDLQQVWTHLITNAIQAMLGKGYLTVALEVRGQQALVIITDSGHGIPNTEQHMVFSPFYTTKTEGEGMGLGLYISKRIIQEHRGEIAFQSKHGQTVFTITLPLAA